MRVALYGNFVFNYLLQFSNIVKKYSICFDLHQLHHGHPIFSHFNDSYHLIMLRCQIISRTSSFSCFEVSKTMATFFFTPQLLHRIQEYRFLPSRSNAYVYGKMIWRRGSADAYFWRANTRHYSSSNCVRKSTDKKSFTEDGNLNFFKHLMLTCLAFSLLYQAY